MHNFFHFFNLLRWLNNAIIFIILLVSESLSCIYDNWLILFWFLLLIKTRIWKPWSAFFALATLNFIGVYISKVAWIIIIIFFIFTFRGAFYEERITFWRERNFRFIFYWRLFNRWLRFFSSRDNDLRERVIFWSLEICSVINKNI